MGYRQSLRAERRSQQSADAFFVANLDTYGGNSGSPVFNSDTHEVEGILVRGEADFVQQGNCQVSLFARLQGAGEDCTRTTEIAQLLEIPWDHIGHADDVVAMAAINGKLLLQRKTIACGGASLLVIM